MAIILRLDRVMADRKVSLNDLAKRVGITNVNLSRIKTGKIRAIRLGTLEAICEALQCQPGDILEYSANPRGFSFVVLDNAADDEELDVEE